MRPGEVVSFLLSLLFLLEEISLESVNVAIIMSDFRCLLWEISNELTDSDLAALKFPCVDVITFGNVEGISQPSELFRALESQKYFSEQNKEFLASKLSVSD